MTASILTILQVSEREIQKQFEQQMQMGNDPLQTELFDQSVWLMKNCDDTRADIKEEYQKELTVFAQRSDKNLTGIRNTAPQYHSTTAPQHRRNTTRHNRIYVQAHHSRPNGADRPGASVRCQGTNDEGREGRGDHATARGGYR